MFYPHQMMFYSPFNFLGSLVQLLFWIFIVVLIIKLIKRHKRGDEWGGWLRGGSALHTLRERYAKGEISKEEYEERKKVLMEK